jgi:16S rRNA C1402 N4-methylase RsmH
MLPTLGRSKRDILRYMQFPEHPPIMTSLVVNSLLGGPRWRDTQRRAETIVKRAVDEGELKLNKAGLEAIGMAPANPKRWQRAKKGLMDPSRDSLEALERKIKASFPSAATAKEQGEPPAKMDSLPRGSQLMLPCHELNVLLDEKETKEMMLPPEKPLVTFDVLDCTFGSGCHSGSVLEEGTPYTRVVALDCDLGVLPWAREVEQIFGKKRFRFFGNVFSEAFAMFGENTFDAVLVDPGANYSQLTDPSRGFGISGEDAEPHFDLRFGRHIGSPALSVVNEVHEEVLFRAARRYGCPTRQARRFSTQIIKNRPHRSGEALLHALKEGSASDIEIGFEEIWFDNSPFDRQPSIVRWMNVLKALVNNEFAEFEHILTYAPMLLRPNGRLVVITRHRWESTLLFDMVQRHPFLLLVYKETISKEEADEFGHHPESTLWAIERTAESSFPLKNALNLTAEKIKESRLRWLFSLDTAPPLWGYPGSSMVSRFSDEKNILRSNRNPMPMDTEPLPTRPERDDTPDGES